MSQLSNSRTVFPLFTTRKRVWSLIFDKSSVSSEMVKLTINVKPKTKVRKNDIETFIAFDVPVFAHRFSVYRQEVGTSLYNMFTDYVSAGEDSLYACVCEGVDLFELLL